MEIQELLKKEQQEWAKTLQKNYEKEQEKKKKEKERLKKRLEEILQGSQEKGGFPLKREEDIQEENDEEFPLVRFRR
jgi:hypothetical protein